MKTCRNCKNLKNDICMEYKMAITDKVGATYCKKYIEKRNIPKGKVKCIQCQFINKYGWCDKKKRCFNEEEKVRDRTCLGFYKKQPKFNIKHKY